MLKVQELESNKSLSECRETVGTIGAKSCKPCGAGKNSCLDFQVKVKDLTSLECSHVDESPSNQACATEKLPAELKGRLSSAGLS